MAEHCNWYWSSHGCDLPGMHDGDHLCGTEDEPCSKHNGTHVLFHLWSATEPSGRWDDDWHEMPGFCFNAVDPDRSCGDPENCWDRGEPWHTGSV